MSHTSFISLNQIHKAIGPGGEDFLCMRDTNGFWWMTDLLPAKKALALLLDVAGAGGFADSNVMGAPGDASCWVRLNEDDYEMPLRNAAWDDIKDYLF